MSKVAKIVGPLSVVTNPPEGYRYPESIATSSARLDNVVLYRTVTD